MRPVAISGTPDGLGALTSTQKALAGLAVVGLLVLVLRKR